MESSIDKQRLALSESSSLMTDIRLRDNAHAGVLAYHPFWLKLALEVVVGDDAARLRPATADESDEDSAAHAEHGGPRASEVLRAPGASEWRFSFLS